MSDDQRGLEPTYAERTDDVDTKVEILRRALRAGNHELALGVADSIKDTVTNERMLHADPGMIHLPDSGWLPTKELPAAWRRWADGWSLYRCVRLTEPIGQARRTEPVDLVVGMPAEGVASPGRELRVARLDGDHPLEIRSQVYGEIRRGPSWLAHLVFEADVQAHDETVFLIFCGNPAAELPDYPSGLSIGGEGVGLRIETPHYVAKLSEQMGQLESLTPKWHLGGLRLSTHGNGHGKPPHASVWCRPMLRDNARLQAGVALVQRNAYLLAPYPEQGGAAGLEALRERLLHPLSATANTTPTEAWGDGASAGPQPLARIGEWSVDWPKKRAIWEALRDVPEDQFSSVNVSLVDMGYIYDVRTRGEDVHVVMTMPHRGRPKYDFLAKPLRTRLEQLPGIGSVVVDLTWEPAWTPNRLTDVGRQKMGLVDG